MKDGCTVGTSVLPMAIELREHRLDASSARRMVPIARFRSARACLTMR
jgi:hypothetical protein